MESIASFFVLLFTAPFLHLERYQNSAEWHLSDLNSTGNFGISWLKSYEVVRQKKPTPITVAIIDNGADITHEALRDFIWTNPGEIPGNGRDDDENGYIDDIHGWNFIGGANKSRLVTCAPEYQRVYFHFKEKFESILEADSISAAQFSEYNMWKIARIKHFQSLRRVSEYISRFRNVILADSIIRSDFRNIVHFDSELSSVKTSNALHYWARNLLIKRLEEHKRYKKDYSSLIDMTKKEYRRFIQDSISLSMPPSDLRNSIVKDQYYDFADRYYGNNDVGYSEIPKGLADHVSYHGTKVAGVVKGVAGGGIFSKNCPVRLMILRAVPNGDEFDKDIALSIIYAVDNGAKVINMSFGKDISPEKKWLDSAILYAEKHNVLIVHAAGNESVNLDKDLRYPTSWYSDEKKVAENFINVGASGRSENRAQTLICNFSNYGRQQVDVFAPGDYIYTSFPGSERYIYSNGTSMAAPVVTGLATYILAYFPNLKSREIKWVIENSVVKPGYNVIQPGTKNSVRFENLCKSGGIVNAYRAVILADQVCKEKLLGVKKHKMN